MKERILLIGHNFWPEPTGIGKYSGDMMDWLAKHGYHCTVVTTFPYYPYWKVQPPYKNVWYKKEVISYPEANSALTIYRCPSYVPEDPTGKKRMIQDISFWSSMFWVILKLILFKKRYDRIITIAPPFHLGYLGWFYKKLRSGKLIYHIQDLQIEAAQELNMLSSERLFKWLYAAEKKILKDSDIVSSISDGMIAKIGAKAGREVVMFPNWVDTSLFFPITDRSELKQQWGYTNNQLVCLYSGSIGEKQGIENVIYCAKLLKDVQRIKFVICGTGPYKQKLEQLVATESLTNVDFLPLQDKEVFNAFLNMADIHLVIQKGNASDLVMPSKLTTILAIGGACIVTSPPGTSLHELIEKYDVGFVISPDDVEGLKAAILEVAEHGAAQQRINARSYAESYLSIDNVMDRFVKTMAV